MQAPHLQNYCKNMVSFQCTKKHHLFLQTIAVQQRRPVRTCSLLLLLSPPRFHPFEGLVANLLIHVANIAVRAWRNQRILFSITRCCEAPKWSPPMRGLPVWANTKWVFGIEIPFIVNITPVKFDGHVSQVMIVIRKRIRPLTVSIRHGFLELLSAKINIGIEENMPPKNRNHQPHGHHRQPHKLERRSISSPGPQEIFKIIIRNTWICDRLQQNRISLSHCEHGPIARCWICRQQLSSMSRCWHLHGQQRRWWPHISRCWT